LTVLAAAQAAVEKLQLKFPRCTAAIEGFGNVGGSLALGYARQGVKVVAVSTIQGAIYDPHGLDIPRLLKIYREFGSGMVEKASAEQISKEEIVELDVDILSPCARGWSITEQNAERIKAKIIAPGANCPVTPEAERILAEKRILSVPHFAANCGGALGSTMEFLGCKKEQIANFIAVEVKKKITVLLDKAECQQILPSELAEKEALAKLKAMRTSYQNGLKSIALRLGMEAYKSGLLPAGLTRIALLHYLKRRLWSG
jgi:glutamate dehydrogenase/leucine dehydrogenase